ncbi:MAG: hypothetical protein LBS51_01985 [Oscillospiraceae bacterium]|jgi:hypothetical protein|nr:hypothetical protein [Oscillospiraceae bacterium]
MIKTKRKLLSVAIAIALVLALSVAALAAWPSFQNDNTNNGVIPENTALPPPIASTTTPTTISLSNNGAQYSGVDTATVISSGGIAYTLYNGGPVSGSLGGARLQATNVASSSTVWNIQISTTQPTVSDAFILSTPYLDEPSDTLYLATTWHLPDYSTYGWEYWMVPGVSGSSAPTPQLLDSGSGQANTPISGYLDADDELQYIYFGTYTGAKTGTYRQYPPASGAATVFAPKDDFYYAGATVVTIEEADYVVFGGDNGLIYVNPVGASFATPANTLVLNYIQGTAPGAVRSSIMWSVDYLDYVFFTSQGTPQTAGILWQVAFSDLLGSSTSNGVLLQGKGSTTSTPVISDFGVVYVGTYYVDPTTFISVSGTVEVYSASASPAILPKYLTTVYSGDDGVQSSMIVWSDWSTLKDYIYFTTNVDHTQDPTPSANHNGYCYAFDIAAHSASQVWNPTVATPAGSYALQGFAYDSTTGHVIYGDDSDTLYIF